MTGLDRGRGLWPCQRKSDARGGLEERSEEVEARWRGEGGAVRRARVRSRRLTGGLWESEKDVHAGGGRRKLIVQEGRWSVGRSILS